MTKEEALEMLNEKRDSMLSDEATNVIDNVIYNIENEDEDFEIDDYEVDERIMDEVNDTFIYYDDAFSYLQNNQITDFNEAVISGYSDVCSIASYFLLEEILKA